MKLILSRKGFDASEGGCASPIFPDGRLISIPIPDPAAPLSYRDILVEGQSIAEWVRALSRGRIRDSDHAHLDPDLDSLSCSRVRGWRPCFGQNGTADAHLRHQGVGIGDLFLFFGWFKEVCFQNGSLRYLPCAPNRHVIFGWLQIGRRIDLPNEVVPRWARSHPHLFGRRGPSNSLYVSCPELRLAGEATRQVSGAGIFRRFRDELVLTEKGFSRSMWSLPDWFHPTGRGTALSYHEDPRRWSRVAGRTRLRSVSRGQEFVLDCKDYPEASSWLNSLFSFCA